MKEQYDDFCEKFVMCFVFKKFLGLPPWRGRQSLFFNPAARVRFLAESGVLISTWAGCVFFVFIYCLWGWTANARKIIRKN